jgi:EAL domain-containing protein (putative c-di-GMP-specific phosphodiesterase class I)
VPTELDESGGYNVDVSIDDFGSGYSTLERLQSLPFTELKIARDHVDGCSVRQQQYVKCESMVGLAHRFGMIAVAEGVERSGDLQALAQMTCDVAQGRLLGEPMERTKFRAWAKQRKKLRQT